MKASEELSAVGVIAGTLLCVVFLLGAAIGFAAGWFGRLTLFDPGPVVTRIIDGDTLELAPFSDGRELAWADRGTEKVRLLCVDAPERGDAHAAAATAWLRAQLPVGTVLALERGEKPRDVFGRLLTFVYTEKRDVDVGLAMVREGHARVYRKAPCPRIARYDAAEAEARAAKLGIWQDAPAP